MMTKLSNFNNCNTDAFKRETDEIDWSLPTGTTDVKLSFEIFLRLIGNILDKYARPSKKNK